MAVTLSDEQYNAFINNGYTDDDIGATIKRQRSEGMPDSAIYTAMNKKYREIAGIKDIVTPQMGDQPNYDAIMNNPALQPQQQAQQIQQQGEAYRAGLDKDLMLQKGRIGVGSLISGAGLLPVFGAPGIPSAIGGGIYGAGQAIAKGEKLPEIAKETAGGAAAGYLVPKALSKGGELIAPLASKIGNTKVAQAIGKVLTKEYQAPEALENLIKFGSAPQRAMSGVEVPPSVKELGELATNPQTYVAKTGRPVGLSRLPKDVPIAEAPTVGEAPTQQLAPNKFAIEADTDVEQPSVNAIEQPQLDYKGVHTAPSENVGATLDNLENIYPDDIYSNKAAQYYGHYGSNNKMDKDTINIIQKHKSNPDAEIEIYRAIPKDLPPAEQKINKSDWVTINKDYAVEHGESALNGKYQVVSKKVKVKDLFTDGNSIHEWGYNPTVETPQANVPEMVQPQEIKSLNKQSLQKGLNIELQKIKDSIEIPEVTKGTYVQGRYKNRFFQKNITDDMTRDFIDADISLQQTIKEIKKNPSVINDYDRLEADLEKQVSKLPKEAQMEYYNKFQDAIGKAAEHEQLKATQLTPENLGFNSVDIPQGQMKTRGGIKTIGKGFGEDVANQVTDRTYETRGLARNEAEFANLTPEQQMDLVKTDDVSDLAIRAKQKNLENQINAGAISEYDINKFARQGTEQAQAFQARDNMHTPVGALTATQSVIRKATPKRINDIIDNADNIVAQTKKITEEVNVEKQAVQQQFDEWLAKQQQPKTKKVLNEKGDRLALGKAMERYRIQKDKELIRLEEKRIKTIENMIKDKEVSPKNRKYLIDNILKLEDLGGLTPDNVIKLVNKKYSVPEISQTDVEKIKELTTRISEATTERESEVAKGLLRKFMVDKVPKTVRNKVNTYRYINMLLSPKSRSKDFIFTAAFQGEQMIDELFAQLPAMASRVFKGINTRSGLQPKAWIGGLKKGLKEGAEDVRLGIETGRAGEGTRFDLPRGQQFAYTPLKDIGVEPNVIKKIAMAGENVLSKLEKALNYTIRVPDRMFYEAKYASSIADQLKAANVKEPTSEMIEQAVKEAKDAVYQGDTWASKVSLGARDFLNKVPTGPIKVGDLTMPFVQTLANITEEGLKNVGGLPVGMSKWAASKTAGELRDAELLIGKGLKSLGYLGVGGGIAAGAIKSNIGDLSLTGKDRDAVTGMQPQSIAIGNKSFSLANAPNVTIPIAIYKSLLEQGTPQDRALRAGMAAATAMGDMPAFKTLGDLAKSGGEILSNAFDDDTKGAIDAAKQMGNQQIANVTGQFIPLTGAMGNIRNIVDPYSREQYTQDLGQYIGNKTINRIPFASQSLPQRYGITGQPVMMTNIKNPIARAAGELVDPFSVRNYTPNQTIDTMSSLVKQSKGIEGNKAFNIKKAKRSIDINGVRTKLSPKEYSAYQKDYGKINYYLRQKALKSKTWKMANNEERVKYMRDLNSSIDQAVKSVLFNHSPKKQEKYTQEIIDNYDTYVK